MRGQRTQCVPDSLPIFSCKAIDMAQLAELQPCQPSSVFTMVDVGEFLFSDVSMHSTYSRILTGTIHQKGR